MKKKILFIIGIVVLIGIGTLFYMFNMPHRDVTSSKIDYKVQSTILVQEFLDDREKANDKYLSEDGDSKILQVTGRIDNIAIDQNGQKVVLLKNNKDKMGVSVTFTKESNAQLIEVELGNELTIKGVIRSGAEFDEDLDLMEDVIIEKGSIVK